MKKEFKAPIVEAKEFTAESIMIDAFVGSEDNTLSKKWTDSDQDAANAYKIWKGLK